MSDYQNVFAALVVGQYAPVPAAAIGLPLMELQNNIKKIQIIILSLSSEKHDMKYKTVDYELR
jgi:hypothetical protein